jgi:hypothetical protein
LTFVENPLMRWIWFGGCLAGVGACIGLAPSRRIVKRPPDVPAPHAAKLSANRKTMATGVSHG